MDIDHLSVTQMSMYRRCSYQYYLRYCENLIRPPSGSMTRGSAYHVGVAHNLAQKIESHEDLPVAEVLDAYATDFDDRSEYTEWGNDDPDTMKDAGVAVLRIHHEKIAPGIQPIDVEQQFLMKFKGLSYTFKGIADVITAESVIDHKTAGKKYSEPFHDHKIQLWAYGTGEHARTGKMLDGRVDYAVATSKPQVLSYTVPFTEEDELYFLSLMGQIADGIQKEVWVPNRSHFLCSRKYCGYANLCEKKFHGRVKD